MRYWENERPQTATTTKNVLTYNPQAGKLHVSRPAWTNDEGEEKPGKTVVLDVAALHACAPALAILKDVLA